jgi:nicotinamidase-related amidase
MVSQKEKSNQADTQKSALLVIDVQNDLFEKKNPVYNADTLLTNINALVENAHKAGALVVYIQHNGKKHLIKGTEGWHLHTELHPEPVDWRISKENSDSFENTGLAERLTAYGISHVVATGLVTHGCVKNTCLGAIKEGFKVTLAADAHSNFSKNAVQMIEKWHKILAENGVTVLDSGEICF